MIWRVFDLLNWSQSSAEPWLLSTEKGMSATSVLETTGFTLMCLSFHVWNMFCQSTTIIFLHMCLWHFYSGEFLYNKLHFMIFFFESSGMVWTNGHICLCSSTFLHGYLLKYSDILTVLATTSSLPIIDHGTSKSSWKMKTLYIHGFQNFAVQKNPDVNLL